MVCEPISETQRQARRKYATGIAINMAAYVALTIGAVVIVRNFEAPQWLRVILALLPVAPALLMLRSYLTYLNAMDEFQRRLQTDALLMAAGITVFGTFAYGFLEEFANLPHVSMLWVFPIFSFTFGAAHALIRHRYT
jgi:hypothetical protein